MKKILKKVNIFGGYSILLWSINRVILMYISIFKCLHKCKKNITKYKAIFFKQEISLNSVIVYEIINVIFAI